jgi:hypothetical protein
MADPTAAETRELLDLNTDALSDARFAVFLKMTKNQVTSTDHELLLFHVAWKLAQSAAWSHAQRVGDVSYSAPDPIIWREEYVRRCQDLDVKPVGLGVVALRKVNSERDDYPENWSESQTSTDYANED